MSLEDNLNKILIIDFGSQFTQLIARRVRELGVYSQIISHKKINNHILKTKKIIGIILSGGPLNVYEEKKVKFNKKIQIKFFPIAFFNNLATTLLSTPPDKAQITFDAPTEFFTLLISIFFLKSR